MLFIAVVAHASLARGRDSANGIATARMLGVFDSRSGAPIAGVQVRDVLTGAYALTTETGTVRLDFLSYRGTAAVVHLTKLGYEAKTILVARDDTVSITELLERITTLAPVITAEHYRIDRDPGRRDGFAQRCRTKAVTCFGDSVLATHQGENIADVVLKAPGVTIGACGSEKSRNTQCGKASMRSAVIPPAYCEPSIFVDGFWWNPHAGSAVDLTPRTPAEAPFTPANVKAIEVYSTEQTRPLRFEGDPLCGAIVIWTR